MTKKFRGSRIFFPSCSTDNQIMIHNWKERSNLQNRGNGLIMAMIPVG